MVVRVQAATGCKYLPCKNLSCDRSCKVFTAYVVVLVGVPCEWEWMGRAFHMAGCGVAIIAAGMGRTSHVVMKLQLHNYL